MTESSGQPDHESTGGPAPTPPAGDDRPIEPPSSPPPSSEPTPPSASADKAPAKKAPVKNAAKAPAKKAPAKKAPAKKAAAKKPPAATSPAAVPPPPPVASNGFGQLAEGARETAAAAKSTVDGAPNPLSPPVSPAQRSPGPLVAAGIFAVLGLLLLRRLRRSHTD